MSEPTNIVYDTIETVLLAAGPNYGLQMEDRITCLDLKTMAAGDELFTPSSENESDMLELFVNRQISFEQFNRDCYPLFFRYGTFEFAGELYRIELFLMEGNDSSRFCTQEEINAAIHNGDYIISLKISEYDHSDKNKHGKEILDISLYQAYSAESPITTIEELDLQEVPEPVNVSVQTSTVDYEVDPDQSVFSGLAARLKPFMEKYPVGTVIDPVRYTLEFLEHLRS